jgi:transposase
VLVHDLPYFRVHLTVSYAYLPLCLVQLNSAAMPKFIQYNYNQHTLYPISFKDHINVGSLEHTIHRLVEEEIDTTGLENAFENDYTGRPGYHPKILLKIVLLAYSRGITSSRRIERLCRENITFIALSCGLKPDHSTIANFIISLQDKILAIFRNVLLVCHELDLLGNTHFSLDGLKLPGNASKDCSGTFTEVEYKRKKIEKKIKQLIYQHKQNDAHESTGQCINEDKKHKQQIEKLNRQAERVRKLLSENAPKKGVLKEENKSNVTDNDSAKMSTMHGVIQGYNCQALVDDKHQEIVHGQVSGHGQDYDHVGMMIDGAKENMEAIGHSENHFEGKILSADANYHSEKNLRKCEDEKIDAYIPDVHFRKRDERFTEQKKYKSNRKKKFEISYFIFNKNDDNYICPNKKILKLKTRRQRIYDSLYRRYQASENDCIQCKLREKCLRDEKTKFKSLAIFIEKVELSLSQKMVEKIDLPESRKIYEKRLAIVEPVFSNIRYIKRLIVRWTPLAVPKAV